MKHIVTVKQKSTRNVQEIKKKESKHNTTESHQHRRKESKIIGKEQKRTKKSESNE